MQNKTCDSQEVLYVAVKIELYLEDTSIEISVLCLSCFQRVPGLFLAFPGFPGCAQTPSIGGLALRARPGGAWGAKSAGTQTWALHLPDSL